MSPGKKGRWGLSRRHSYFYFRLRLPADLQRFFKGRRELRRSLKTTCYNDAKALVRAELYRAERLFVRLRGGYMTKEEARKLVTDYFTRNLEEAEDSRADGLGVLKDSEDGEHGDSGTEGLELQLEGMREDLARGERRGIESVADAILEEAGVSLPKDSHDYRNLAREALKGAIEATQTELRRMKGDYRDIPLLSSGLSLAPPTAAPQAPSPPRVVLSAALAEYVKEYDASGRWRKKTREETEGVYRLLVGIVGDRDMAELDYKVLSSFREALSKFPSNHTKRPAYRGKTIPEILALKMKVSTPLSVSSVNKHIIRTGAFLKWAMKRGYVSANFAEGLTIVRKGKESDEREAYSTEDLLRLVQSPLAGFRQTRPERFFIPFLGLYTGARLNELCQLRLEDVRVEDGALCLDITDRGEGQRLKNVSSRRVVPVHPALISVGLKEYVDALRKMGAARLWPALKEKRGGFGDDFSKWYQRWNRKHITTGRKKVFHSLRANFVTALLNAQVDPAIVSALVGHVGGSMTLDRYHKGFSMTMLRDAIEKLSYGREIEEGLRELPQLK
jgi:integrase